MFTNHLFPPSTLVVLLLHLTLTEGTFPVELVIGGVRILDLTANQVTLAYAATLAGLVGFSLISAGTSVANNLIGLIPTPTPAPNLARRRRGLIYTRDDSHNNYIVPLTASIEPQQCFQLLFCTLATETVEMDPVLEQFTRQLINIQGKYRESFMFGKMGSHLCPLKYSCNMKMRDVLGEVQ